MPVCAEAHVHAGRLGEEGTSLSGSNSSRQQDVTSLTRHQADSRGSLQREKNICPYPPNWTPNGVTSQFFDTKWRNFPHIWDPHSRGNTPPHQPLAPQ